MPCVSVVKGLAPRLLLGAVPLLSNKSLVNEFAFPTLPARWGLDCSRFPVWLWPEPCFRPQAAERCIILLSASYCGRSGHFPLRTPIPKGEGDGGISNALESVRTGTPSVFPHTLLEYCGSPAVCARITPNSKQRGSAPACAQLLWPARLSWCLA